MVNAPRFAVHSPSRHEFFSRGADSKPPTDFCIITEKNDFNLDK